ncbi:MAG: hypothetical protein QCI82_08960 [Candidatus Thermoplasmatota archaeon]|nr:hypothetical protein [Candidatus Thermoplasmatota archaeon]
MDLKDWDKNKVAQIYGISVRRVEQVVRSYTQTRTIPKLKKNRKPKASPIIHRNKVHRPSPEVKKGKIIKGCHDEEQCLVKKFLFKRTGSKPYYYILVEDYKEGSPKKGSPQERNHKNIYIRQ